MKSATGQLPRRTVAALTAGFILAAAAATLLGPSLNSGLAEEDGHLTYLKMLRAERGQTQLGPAYPRPAYPRPALGSSSIFTSLFGGRGRAPAPQEVHSYAPQPKPIAFGPFSHRGELRTAAVRHANFISPARRSIPAGGASISQRSVCVRLCDGFYYPVADYNGPGDDAAHGAICAGMCPGAPTRLYVAPSGSDRLEDAVSVLDRKPYRSLPVAFRHTSKRDATCSCHGPEESVVNSVSLLKDFTLRRGDKVMTEKGIQVFRGAPSLPWRRSDFASLAQSPDVSRSERAALGAIERASGVNRKAPVSPRPDANNKAGPQTPYSQRVITDPEGKTIRLIGPQAFLAQAANSDNR